jgi:hypothetical protein
VHAPLPRPMIDSRMWTEPRRIVARIFSPAVARRLPEPLPLRPPAAAPSALHPCCFELCPSCAPPVGRAE